MFRITKPSFLILIGFVFTCLYISMSDARSIRNRRQSGPHDQLHRRRRYLERLYNNLLIIYRIMNLEQDPETITPVSIHYNQPQTEEIRAIIRKLQSPHVRKSSRAHQDRRTDLSDDAETGSTHVGFTGRLRSLVNAGGEGNGQDFHGDVSQATRMLNGHHNSRVLNGHARSRMGTSAIPLGNGLQMRIKSAVSETDSEVDNDNAILLRKVMKLCAAVNRRVSEVTSGVKVKTCSIQ